MSGLICLAAAAAVRYYERGRMLLKGRTNGKVVDLILIEGEGPYRNRYYPVVEYYAEGKLYKKQMNQGSYPSRWEIGQKIKVIYDPADPSRMRQDERGMIQYLPSLLYGGGAVLLIIGIFLFTRFALRG